MKKKKNPYYSKALIMLSGESKGSRFLQQVDDKAISLIKTPPN